MSLQRTAGEETSRGYLWRRGGRPIGPFSVTQMRSMVRSGELGRSQQVSDDGGTTWVAASEIAELWQSTDLVPAAAPQQAKTAETTSSPGSTSQATVVLPPSGLVPISEHTSPATAVPARHGDRGWGVGLAGFITSTAALTIGLIPMCIWFTGFEPGYALVPLAFPLLVGSITGLVLSAIALSRTGGGFAKSGLVVGICGAALSLTTVIGWLVFREPGIGWSGSGAPGVVDPVGRLLGTAEADMQLARKDFAASLKRYGDHKPNDDHKAAREQLTKNLLNLAQAHKNLLAAAASTPRFRQHFVKLDSLLAGYVQFTALLKLHDQMTPQAAIDDIGRESSTLRELLDLLDLYQTGSLSLEAAQAKFRAY
jgi:hypothetical protein